MVLGSFLLLLARGRPRGRWCTLGWWWWGSRRGSRCFLALLALFSHDLSAFGRVFSQSVIVLPFLSPTVRSLSFFTRLMGGEDEASSRLRLFPPSEAWSGVVVAMALV